MSKIKRLDTYTSNRIAAGEVVERPASIVKELVENSLDANSTSITVEIRGGGIEYIRVTDNGSGIEADDTVVAFERHATSKITAPHDLDAIATLGFRGEALSSIASIAQVELSTRAANNDAGTFVRIHGGEVLSQIPLGCPEGTTMVVQNVFYNTPARLKFLKKAHIEAGYIGEYLSRMIMARPDVSFKYINNAATVYHSAGDGNLTAAIYCVYGSSIIDQLLKVEHQVHDIQIHGFIGGSDAAKQSRTYQSFFVNGRYIRSVRLSNILQEAFGTRLMGGKFPFCVLYIKVPFDSVDVNIHPNKLDVRFRDEAGIAEALTKAVETALGERRIFGISSFVKEAVKENANNVQNVQKEEQHSIFRSTVSGLNTSVQPRKDNGWGKDFAFEDKPEKIAFQSSGRPAVSSMQSMDESLPMEMKSAYQKSTDFAPIDDSHIRVISITSAVAEKIDESVIIREKDRNTQAVPDFSPISEPFSIIGQAFATYIIIQQGETLFFIDQHAAHERLLYDKLTHTTAPIAAQQLLVPSFLQLEQTEYALLKQNEELIRSFGFAFTFAEEPAVEIQAVPLILEEGEGINFLHDAIETLAQTSMTSASRLKRDALALAACKRAIKANTPLSSMQIESLLDQFSSIGVLNCPHGRPIIIKMTKRDLEKLFRRIV